MRPILAILAVCLLTGCAWQKAHTLPVTAYPYQRDDWKLGRTMNDVEWNKHLHGRDYADQHVAEQFGWYKEEVATFSDYCGDAAP